MTDYGIAALEILNALADLFYPAGILMPHNIRQLHVRLLAPDPLDYVKIGTTNPSPTNPDDYVGTLLYFRFRDFLQGHEFRAGKFSIILVKNSGFHNLMKSKTGSNGA
jgi:hypothetical protein